MGTPTHVRTLKRKLGEMMTVIDQAAEDETIGGKPHLELCNLSKTSHEVLCGLQKFQDKVSNAYKNFEDLRDQAHANHVDTLASSRKLILDHVQLLEDLTCKIDEERDQSKQSPKEKQLWALVKKIFAQTNRMRTRDDKQLQKHRDTHVGLQTVAEAYWEAYDKEERAESLDAEGEHRLADEAWEAGRAVARNVINQLDAASDSSDAEQEEAEEGEAVVHPMLRNGLSTDEVLLLADAARNHRYVS
tara:strand:+ start:713 stop:1450 length:738 start_codon:yes stop_codon:yes gene_type:complete